MKFLLDTHVFLWAAAEEHKLSPAVRSLLAEPSQHELMVSVASLWEIVLKVQTAKLVLPEPVDQFLQNFLSQGFVRLLHIEPRHLLPILQLPNHHRDPFDRLLIAQAQVEDATLVTADQAITRYAVATMW